MELAERNIVPTGYNYSVEQFTPEQDELARMLGAWGS